MIEEYQYLFVACSAYLAVMEAKLRKEKVPDAKLNQARALFQAAYVRAGLRFKNIPAPHYTMEEVLKMMSKLVPEGEVKEEDVR